jgi:pyruvate dehydrogenase E2 component (dihydrolipoamide acetyltransferase)
MRKTIASRLQQSYRDAVHVTVSREVDAGAMLEAAETAEAGGAAEDGGDAADGCDPEVGTDSDTAVVDVAVTDVLLRSLSDALAAHPSFNATFEDGTHRIYEEHNVGVAVDVEAGLVTPVVADVGSKSLAGVARERRRLTEAVRAGDYSMSDLRGGTFTLSNLGPLGVDSFSPVINPPEVAILGVGRIADRPRRAGAGDDAVDSADGSGDSDRVEFREVLTLDLSFDHRVVDGADAARFLDTLADHVESARRYVEG